MRRREIRRPLPVAIPTVTCSSSPPPDHHHTAPHSLFTLLLLLLLTPIYVFVALKLSTIWGLRLTLIAGSSILLTGICLVTWFPHISVEIVGLVLIGVGVGFIWQGMSSLEGGGIVKQTLHFIL